MTTFIALTDSNDVTCEIKRYVNTDNITFISRAATDRDTTIHFSASSGMDSISVKETPDEIF
ncbi:MULTISPECIES: hypothetical protein [Bradyrhizobium]|jgi:hypothetical protein|nr:MULTISPECIES: hypothetical protein [Bradyrhizobium]MBR0947726.1 hypothetical protein [Bradyrhizobium liaoningense]MCS3929281.1 cold shock CspA family protein [Bradyrhizobium elkanii]MCS3969837.1 cold shock CspA family protein [Bradyrhizobium japonicum]